MIAYVSLLGVTVLALGNLPSGPPMSRVTSCIDNGCHSDVTSTPWIHGPTAAGACVMCHEYEDPLLHTFALKRTGAQLCDFCHIGKTDSAGLFVHDPVSKGECLSCHDPHGGNSPALLKQGGVVENCRSCHEGEEWEQGSVLHTPVQQGDCLGCHEPHSSLHEKLLVEDSQTLCLRCHEDLDLANVSKHEPSDPRDTRWWMPVEWNEGVYVPGEFPVLEPIAEPAPASRVIHDPVLHKCSTCHSHHGAQEQALLVEPIVSLCGSCHEDLVDEIRIAPEAHSIVTEERACSHCHEPHASLLPALMKAPMLEVCSECHADPPVHLDMNESPWMTTALETGNVHAGLNDACARCHDVHGAQNPALLVRPMSDAIYQVFAAETYALCLGCHDADLVESPETTTATNFRNGSVNLHYVHVKKPGAKGRSCSMCHGTHLSLGPRLLKNDVGFGKWRLPISFKETRNGGTCVGGCHRVSEYDRVTPLPIPLLIPNSKPVEAGVEIEPDTAAGASPLE